MPQKEPQTDTSQPRQNDLQKMPKAHESSPDQKPTKKRDLSDLTKQVQDSDLHKGGLR
jgi:hypothetical protein